MNIRIAAFGSESLIRRVEQYVSEFQGIEWKSYIYEKIEESPELVRTASEADVLLFTGSLPFTLSELEIEKRRIPAVYIPLDEYIVSLTMFNVIHHLKHEKFSLDIAGGVDVKEVFDEAGVDMENIYTKNFDTILKEEGILDYNGVIEFHESLYISGKTEIAVTCVSNVYKELIEKNIPVIRMVHPQKTIKDALRRAIMKGELERSKKAQIVVGYVMLSNYQRQVKDKGVYLVENNALVLHQLLLDFSSEIQASVQRLGKDEFIIYGTKGAFEWATHHYQELLFLKKVEKLLEIQITIGFGFGLTTKEAESNAQIALKYSSESVNKNEAYIIDADKRLIGPLLHEIKEGSKPSHQNDFDNLLLLSKRSGINLQNTKKIIEFCKINDFQPFPASDLAEYMQISRRGAERFIKVLAEASIAKIAGEKQISQRGRPTTLYEIDLKELMSPDLVINDTAIESN